MNSIETLFQQKRIVGQIGIITAHPDDDISFGSLLEVAEKYGIVAHELIYSLGSASTKNFVRFSNPNFDVAKGHRRKEGSEGARRLGIKSVEFASGDDGKLTDQQEILAYETVTWAKIHNIGTFATLGFHDHQDHNASHQIALRAAILLRDETPSQPVNILTVHHNGEGEWWTSATATSIERTYYSAQAHASQMPFTNQLQPGWPTLPLGLTLPPDVHQELQVYPLDRDASFSFQHAGSLVLQHS